MPRLLRTLLMWLLALALPVQGFAAASMAGCGARHGVAAVHSHAMGMHGHAAQLAHHAHGHLANAMAQAGHSHHADEGATSGHHHDGKFSKTSCSACASCCMSAALPATLVVFEATRVRDTFVSLAPQPVASFVSGGLERPPRPVLA